MRRKARLPAVAAIATVAAIPTIAAPSTTAAPSTAVAASTAATTTAVATTSTAAARAFRLGTRFVDNKVPAAKVLTVETGYRAIRLFIVSDFDESESAGLACEAIANQADRRRADSQLSKPFLQLLF